ncbi:acetylserotonin O-methyltransferase [Thermomicrobiaceae bacterium CFH 74404]|uniref:Acetylserotonin O-methyltransferase n=1 Tax=Thermalbibacter longus TaxID=2951981 RepID=A0AA41WIR1_9BACT|nr:methyltransferase [Thermalbibacter longus]MCM8750111.1 acetylserotonin O-methyltransferase [Thermalbibacter longus]
MSHASAGHRQIVALAQGYQTAALLIAYAELGIADQLAGGPRSAAEVAQAVGADPAAVARLLAAAEALGLAARSGDRWQNTPLSEETLVSDSPRSLVNFLRHQGAFYRRWSRLAEAVRTGRRPEENRQDEAAGDWVRSFTLMLYDIARVQAPLVATALTPLLAELPRPPTIIDVGGGHGEYAMELARQVPGLEAVVFDLPPVIAVTRELIARAGLQDRVRAVTGDFHQDSLGSGYDLALLFGVLVSEDEPSALRLLGKVREALAPGGWIAITAHAPDNPEARLRQALRDLHMLLSTERGRVPGVATIESWLATAGFAESQRLPIEGDLANQVLVARRPTASEPTPPS